MAAQLHETTMGRKLIESVIPDISKQLKRLADNNDYDRSEWMGKEVQIYPGDTYHKFGKIVGMNAHGVTFLITQYSGADKQYQIGKHTFISYSAKLQFKEI